MLGQAPKGNSAGEGQKLSADEIEALILRAAEGDRDAFAALYAATSAKLTGVAYRILQDRAVAEDAVQDAYVKIWHNAGRYRVTGHSPMTWLITIARNTAIDRRRKQRVAVPIDSMAEMLPAPGGAGESAAMARSEAARIAACLQELPADRADAVRGAYLNGDSYAELATRHKVPVNTMRTWLRRSLIRLRECLSR